MGLRGVGKRRDGGGAWGWFLDLCIDLSSAFSSSYSNNDFLLFDFVKKSILTRFESLYFKREVFV